MIPTHMQQGEPLPAYLARKSRTFLFNPAKKVQAEQARAAREQANLQQAIFQLPAELRNQIYDLLIPTGREIRRSQHPRAQGRVPALLHVCRRLRHDALPFFYGNNLVVVTLHHLTQHIRSPQRMRSCVNLLPEAGSADWRRLRVETCSRCFHSDGFAVLANIDVWIDRSAGTISCQPRGAQFLRPCCQAAQKAFTVRFLKDIQARTFHDAEKKLRRDDFERLAQRLDENKWDWPKSPRRVVPQRFARVVD